MALKIRIKSVPRLNVKVKANLPATVLGGTAIGVTRSGGTVTINWDVASLTSKLTIAAAERDNLWLGLYDSDLVTYSKATLQTVIGVGSTVEAWDADLDAIAALTLTGVLCRTATNTWSLRTITGTANEVTVSNGDGVSGNPTVSLPSALTFTGKTITGGTYATALFSNAPTPSANDGAALGTTSLKWSDLFLASGAVIDFNSGDVLITHSANTLAFTGASTGYTFDAKVSLATTVDFVEIASPSSPSADHIVMFAKDVAGATHIFSRDSAGTEIDMSGSASGVSSLNGQTGALTQVPPPQGRLTLQTAIPVMVTTQSAKTTIYYTPYNGRFVPIYDGTNMVPTAFTELSVATTDATKSPAAIGASKVNDWFVWNDSGTIRLGHGPDWTNDTTRSAGTALTMVNGILLNNASLTNGPAASRGTYVGTTRSNGSSQLDWILGASASGGTAAVLGVYNASNRVLIGTDVSDSGASYTYSSATIRQARASSGNQISYIDGLGEDAITVSYGQRIGTASAVGAGAAFGIGFDSTTTLNGPRIAVNAIGGTAQDAEGYAVRVIVPVLGYHFIAGIELSDGTNANTFDTGGIAKLSAIFRM